MFRVREVNRAFRVTDSKTEGNSDKGCILGKEDLERQGSYVTRNPRPLHIKKPSVRKREVKTGGPVSEE